MDFLQSLQHRENDADCFFFRKLFLPFQAFPQGFPFQVFHHNISRSILYKAIVDLHNPRDFLQPGKPVGFLKEFLASLFKLFRLFPAIYGYFCPPGHTGGKLSGQKFLDRNLLIQHLIPAAIRHAKSSGADNCPQ